MEKSEVRAVIKYLQKKGLTPTEIHKDMTDVLGDSAPSYQVVKNMSREFRLGRTTCEHAKGAGRPVCVTVDKNINLIHDMVMADRRLTIRHIAEITNISYGSVENILRNVLDLRKISARWVPKMLTVDQKRSRVLHSEANLEYLKANRKQFLTRFVTVDETWVHHFDPETKRQSMEWHHRGSPPPRKFRVQRAAGKIMATVFWDAEGILMIDYLQRGHTITGSYYAGLIPKLRESIDRKRPGKLAHKILFHQDNAPVHKSCIVMAAIQNAGFEILEHPPYSPDLAPSDYHLFPKLKENLRGKKYGDDNEVMTAVNGWFEEQPENFFLKGIEALEHRWTKCIEVQGDYVEK